MTFLNSIKNESKKYINNIDVIKFVVKPNGGRIVPGTTRTIKSNDNVYALIYVIETSNITKIDTSNE